MNRIAAVLVLLGLVAGPALAQTDATGVLAGRVTTAAGGAVADAVVTTARADGSQANDAVTDAEGRFRFPFLAPGTYQLVVMAEGMTSRELTGIRVSASRTAEVAIELEPREEISEEIVVTAAAPLLDASTTELGSTLQSEELELLPTTRVATDLVEFVPGVRSDQVWGGSTTQANAYQLDGVTVNHPGFGGDFLLPNPDWLEEIEVKGLGAGAEYGNFQGGLVNMVTKTGGNETRGAIRTNWESESLNESNLSVGDAGDEQDSRWEGSGDVSGPIVRDRLYYFLSGQRAETTWNILDAAATDDSGEVTFLPIQEERTETKLFGKLNWEPSDADRVAVVLGWDEVRSDNRGLDSFTAPEAAQEQDSPALLYSASWQRIVNTDNFFELKLTGFDGADDRLPRSETLPAVQLLGGNRDLYRNAVHTRERDLTSNALAGSWNAYLDLGPTTHQVKAGGSWDEGSWLEQRRRNGGYTWRPERRRGVAFDPNDPSTWGFISSDWGGDIRLDAETLNAAFYVQDYVTLTPWLNLSVGVRYGRWEGEVTPGFGGGGAFTALEDSAIDPRIGIVADLTRDGQLLAKAHWGRFHQSLFALLFDRVDGSAAFQDTEYWDWVAPFDPDLDRVYTEAEREQLFEFFDDEPTSDQVGPALDYDQPYVDQIVLGLEKLFGDRWKVGITYVNRKNEEIAALVDRNLDANYTPIHDITVIDLDTGLPALGPDGQPLVLDTLWLLNDDILYVGSAPGLTPDQIDALDYDRDYVLTNVPDATRDMDQVQLVGEHRADHWRANLSLVWTELEGNFFSVSGYDDPDGIGAGAFVLKNEQTNFFGDLENYSEWEAKLRLSGDLPWGMRGGLFYTWTSGDRYAPVFDIDRRNYDYQTADGALLDPDLVYGIDGERILLERRGAREQETYSVLDLYLDRVFPLTDGFDLVLGVDVFNVFDEDAVTAVRTLVNGQDPADPTTLFGAVRGRQAPRTVRLNASLRF